MPASQMSKVLVQLRGIRRAEMEDVPDAQLLARFLAGREEAAFEAVVRRHGPMVLGVCRRILRNADDAEDAFQATFLVLVRKAASITRRETVGGWLYGVARKTALKARAAGEQRRAKERRVGTMSPKVMPAEDGGWELQAVLDQELSRLPDKYRVPVVLCDLEGRTRKQAAQQLGWPEGTVSGRLARARALLARRLARHGLAVAGGVLARDVATACVPNALLASTVQAASGLAAGGAAAAVTVSTRAAALADGVLKGMLLARLKIATAGLLMASLLGGGLLAPLALSEPPAEGQRKVGAAGAVGPQAQAMPERTDRFGDPLPPGAVARLGSLRLYHGQQVKRIALSPDGKWVVSTAADGNRRWDAITGRERPPRGGPWQAAFWHAAVFSTRDKLLAVEKHDLDLQLWDVTTGEKVGEPLAAAGVGQLPTTIHLCWPDGTSPLALSPDGRTLVVSNLGLGGRPVLRFGDMVRGRVEEPVALKEDNVSGTRLAFSADGKTLVLQCNDSTVHVWDVARRSEKIASRSSAADFGGPIAISPDGTVLANAPSLGKRVRLWDTRTFEELPPLASQPDQAVRPMTFSPDSKVLAVTYGKPAVRLWDLATRKELPPLQGKDFYVNHVAFSADGKALAGADGYGATVWDLPAGKLRHDFGHTYMVDAVCFSPDGRKLVSGAAYTDNVVRVWDPLTGELFSQMRGHPWGVEAVAYAPDGKLIASGSQDETIRLWDADTGREVRRLEAKDGMIYAMAFAPDGKTIAGGGKRKAVHLWDVATGRELRSFDNPGKFILKMAFSPDGQRLATRGIDEKEIRLWDVAKGEPIRRLPCSSAGVPSLAFSPDGQFLAAGADDATVRLWDVSSGEERRTLAVPPGEAGRTFSIAFSPDGRTLAAGNGEGGSSTIRLWELSSGRVRALFEGAHAQGTASLAFSPDGTLLASGGVDRLIMVWDVTGQRIALARKDGLTPGEFQSLWDSLGDEDARKAYRAVQALLGSAGPAVSLLGGRLRPAAATDGPRIDRLLADLDSDQFEVRQKAHRQLREMGNAAEPALRKALADKPSAEQRLRIKELLQEADPAHFPELLRELRAVEVLERVGTAEARQVLQTLAGGAGDARLTREAKASLGRMRARQATRP
jgi:RNA polymerase sigma factor (sigma-70 family)